MSYHIPCFYEINRCMFHLLTGENVVKIYNFPITAHLPPIFCVLVFDYVKLRPPPTTPPLETSKFIVDFRFDHVKSPLYRSTLLLGIGPSHRELRHFVWTSVLAFWIIPRISELGKNFAENSAVNRKVTVSFLRRFCSKFYRTTSKTQMNVNQYNCRNVLYCKDASFTRVIKIFLKLVFQNGSN